MTANERAALAELIWELTAPHTSEEIAEHLGISQSTVSRIESRALSRLRGELLKQGKGDWQGSLKEPLGLHKRQHHIGGTNGRTKTGIEDA